jgi:hypothetical protein
VYDVIVVGSQVGAALAAGLLARRGRQVLHVPHGGPAGSAEPRLPRAPFLLPPLKALPALDEALTELGVNVAFGRALHVAPLQLLEPDRWFELSHDEKRRGPELARAFGDGAEGFDQLARQAEAAAAPSDAFIASRPDLPPEGLFARWRFKRALARFPGLEADTPLPQASLLRGLLPFVAPVAAPAALTRARVLGHTLAGPARFLDDREGLLQQLAERARELGADVLGPEVMAEALSFDGATVGLRLARGDTVYRAPFVVAGLDLEEVAGLVPEKQRRAGDKALARVTATKAVFTLNLVLPEKGLPRGLGELALLPAEVEGGAVLLQVTPGATADLKVLSLSAVAPLALKQAGEPAVRAFIAQLHACLATVAPFTRAHVRQESASWLDAPGRPEAAPLFSLPPDSWLGVSGHGTVTPWKRVLLAGRQVLPGLGLEGEVLAARRAVRHVEAKLKKDDPLKGRRPA